MPTLSIERRELAAQPTLFVRTRAARHEISAAIGQSLGKAYPYVLSSGQAIAGRPFTRYLSVGPGLFTMEIGVPISATAPGQADVEAGTLPSGPAVVGVHAGTYEQLGETYAAMERWMEANGLKAGGAPWESYITDPAEHPDPADWRTEIYWPVAKWSTAWWPCSRLWRFSASDLGQVARCVCRFICGIIGAERARCGYDVVTCL